MDGVYLGVKFSENLVSFPLFLCNKIPTPKSQLLHFTKYIHILYLQQMHKLK